MVCEINGIAQDLELLSLRGTPLSSTPLYEIERNPASATLQVKAEQSSRQVF
jgi:hypothetical protein